MILEDKMNRFLVFLALLAGLFFQACKPREYFFIQGSAQGTSYHIKYADQEKRDFSAPIDSILKAFDLSLSIYKPESLISRFNQNDPDARADKWFTEVFEKAMQVSEESEGAFDITVGPLVNAWGFGRDSSLHVDGKIIDSLLQFVGYKKVVLKNGLLIKEDPRMFIDVNALAQGYSCDVVADFFKEQGIKHYMIEIGGEVRAQGKNPENADWQIGIDKPVTGNYIPGSELQAIMQLKNKSLATSGNYRKFHEINGVKYAHTINPHTGYPVMQNLLSASILASDCISADAYATTCMVIGLEKSKAFLQNHPELEAYLIYSDSTGQFQIWKTKNFPVE
jgi:FAD:protein FMN transferase